MQRFKRSRSLGLASKGKISPLLRTVVVKMAYDLDRS